MVRASAVPGIVDVPPVNARSPSGRRVTSTTSSVSTSPAAVEQQLKVALKPNFAVISVGSIPAGAQIEVDGKPAGVTPAKVEMDSGIRRVQLSAPGLRVWTSSVAVNAGVPQTIGPIELGAADARITVRSVPSGAQVTTGGSFRGVTPLDPGACARSFAFHEHRAGRVRAVDPRSVRRVRQGIALDARLAALSGRRAYPGPAGRCRGYRQRHFARARAGIVQLPASRRHIEVRKEGFEPFVADVVLAPGIARTLAFKLLDPRDVLGNSPPRITTKSGIQLLIVAGGTFQAGTDRREQGRRPNEGSHKVTLTRPFYMGEREVTNGQFRKFRPSHNSGAIGNVSLDLDGGRWRGLPGTTPLEFCNWLSAQEGLPPAYSGGGETGFTTHHAGDQWLSPAHRGRMGVRGARREHRQTAEVPGARICPSCRIPPTSPRHRGFPADRRVAGGRQDEFPRWPRRRCRPIRSASTTSPEMCRSGPTTAIFPSSLPPRSPIRSDPPSKGYAYRGSNWRSTSTSELRFPWREGGIEATDVIGFRVARYVAPE